MSPDIGPYTIKFFKRGTAVVGGHFGDEGKGKQTDAIVLNYLNEGYKVICIRAQGGGNAGHTVVDPNTGISYFFHYLPSGALRSQITLLGAGMLLDPFKLTKEIEQLSKDQQERVYIDERATLCSTFERCMDGYYESKKTKKIGTTGSGVGPAVSYRALRVDIRLHAAKACKNWLELKELYMKIPDIPEKVIQQIAEKHGSFDKYVEDLFEAIQGMKIVNGQEIIQKAKHEGYALVLEVSQAAGLDMIHGNEGKFVTSTHTTATGALADAGLGVNDIPDGTIVVTKAYGTKVGAGHFPTKANDDFVNKVRAKFGVKFETGVTTGRNRDIGWFDAVYIRYALQLNGTANLAINCMDLLGKWPENQAKICIAYANKKTQELIDYVPFKTEEYEPVYLGMSVEWNIDGYTDENQLPESVWKFLAYVTYYTGARIRYIGTGPKSTDFVEITEAGRTKIKKIIDGEIARESKLLQEAITEVTQMSADIVHPDPGVDEEYGEDEKPTLNNHYITAEDSENSERIFVVYQDDQINTGLWIAKPIDTIFSEESKGSPKFEDGNYDLPEFPKGREITPDSKWSHFKGTVSTIICIAREATSGDYYVVYECGCNAGKTNHCDGILARPLDNFLSPTDRNKYPDKEKYPQENRFEKIE